MHKNATKCNKTLSKWCKNKHGASKIIDTFETYQISSGNLRRLVDAFDTLKDPTLALKRSSVRRDAEATVALAMSHGENVDWEKVSSPHALGPLEMKEFFSEAKKYSPNLVSLILHVPSSSTAAPSSSAPPAPDSTPSEVS
jgi:hypothetical protein